MSSQPWRTEVAEMLTTTCENAGCSKSITRKELLGYVEKSGGRDYPFHHKGRILRVATIEDLNKLEGTGGGMIVPPEEEEEENDGGL